MAIFENETNDTLIIGTIDNDSILNFGNKVTISGSDGDDTINNAWGKLVTIYGGAGNDSFYNYEGDYALICSGDGNDSIINSGDSVTIDCGTGNDYIKDHGSEVLFKHTSGNDTIEGFYMTDSLSIASNTYTTTRSSSNVVVTTETGTITLIKAVGFIIYIGTGSSTTTGGGDDTQQSGGDEILLTSSNDTLKNTLDSAIIDALGGNDSIRNYGDDVLIDSGAGDDSIRNYGDNVTIYGGTGNDTIRNAFGENVLFNYSAGNGNDVIIGFNDSSTLKIGDGTATYSTVKSGNNIIVTAGSGKLTLAGAATLDTLNIVGTEKTYKTLKLTDKSSAKINLSAAYAKVNGMNRTTAIQITGNSLDNTISGGGGNDTLSGGAGSDSLLGSDGNDKLYGGSGDDTLFGGMGNDSLWGQAGADTFLYTEGTGKDVIFGFDNDDMLQITGEFTATYNATTKAVAFKVGSTYNSVILKNFTATTFNINGEAYKISGNTFVKK